MYSRIFAFIAWWWCYVVFSGISIASTAEGEISTIDNFDAVVTVDKEKDTSTGGVGDRSDEVNKQLEGGNTYEDVKKEIDDVAPLENSLEEVYSDVEEDLGDEEEEKTQEEVLRAEEENDISSTDEVDKPKDDKDPLPDEKVEDLNVSDEFIHKPSLESLESLLTEAPAPAAPSPLGGSLDINDDDVFYCLE